jgi:NADPH-dependent 2,4-dienoyl-CoA reductase/sulfur reductase-like enzyme
VDRVVVVGGSLAGVNAIEGLRERGYQGEITLVGAESHLPYDRPPLSKDALREGPAVERLLLKQASWYDEHGVELRLGASAVGLDTRQREVVVGGGDPVPYDGLVIATGCSPRALGTLDAGPVHVVRTVEDAAALHGELRPGRHLVVIGAGFIGLEVAATARGLGLHVSVVEMAPVPLTRVLGDEAGSWFQEYHADRGVDLYCGSVLDGIEVTATGTRLRLGDGTVLTADLVVAGVGVTPATDWLEGSGVTLDNGIVCDRTLRASAPGVVAAGDIVRWHNDLFDETMRVEQWLNAVEQGAHAGHTLLGAGEPFAPVPYFWSDQFDAQVRFVGRADAADAVEVQRLSDRSMVALFGRGGVVRGALCVNAPRQLARYRVAIQQRVAWGDAVGSN